MIKLITTIILVLIVGHIYGTHNRAGEITYVQLSPLEIEATVTTYTKASSTGADRDSILIIWGDGNEEFIFRTNGSGEAIPGEDIKINYYTQRHIYPGRATYTLAFQDPNRVNNIQNVNFPNSVDVPFYVETTFTLIESQFQGPNNSVILLQPPIDFACVGFKFTHNPNAYDIDGDSLTFELITPLQSEGMPVPSYKFPDQISPGQDNLLTIDSATGDLVWNSPPATGEYNVAIRINEYRQGFLLNSVTRDMQILVDECDDTPPEVETIEEICVVAGTSISIPVVVTDIDIDQMVRLSATGGPFQLPFSPAFLDGDFDYHNSDYTRRFVWDTKCEHISDSYYSVIFRGQDNSRGGESGNAVLKTLRIKVVGPPPEGLDASLIEESNVKLTWNKPYQCDLTLDDFFIGFRVYRRERTNPTEIDSCTNGLNGQGYEVIKFLTEEFDNDGYFYVDDNLEKGKIYCYRVLANFADKTSSGQLFNIVESLASEEVCISPIQDLPLITEVSVNSTDEANGQISLSWVTPLTEDVDTMEFPGPYSYKIRRSDDGINYSDIAQVNSDNLGPDRELNYLDNQLNTSNTFYQYEIELENDFRSISTSAPASMIKSQVLSTDRENNIISQFDVPWFNFLFELELQDDLGNFTTIDRNPTANFFHTNIDNLTEYCYRIKSYGTYGLANTRDTLINYSQITCGIPIDTVGPCPPTLTVDNPCDKIDTDFSPEDFINKLTWSNPISVCLTSQDLVSYNIYYSVSVSDPEFELIANILSDDDRQFNHLPDLGVNGCYKVNSVDILGNEGPDSNVICVDNCPIYTLPNTFTPNGDGANDLFVPTENKFVSAIEFKLFNRWGNLLFETIDPEINWNGISLDGQTISPGTYYYICKVFETDEQGSLTENILLNGHIQLIR